MAGIRLEGEVSSPRLTLCTSFTAVFCPRAKKPPKKQQLTASTLQGAEPSRTPGSRFRSPHPDALRWSQHGGRSAFWLERRQNLTAQRGDRAGGMNHDWAKGGRQWGEKWSGERLGAIQATSTAFPAHDGDVCVCFTRSLCALPPSFQAHAAWRVRSVSHCCCSEGGESFLSHYPWLPGSPGAPESTDPAAF